MERALLTLALAALACSGRPGITVFAGSASAAPLKELAAAFENERGVKVNLITGGMGSVLTQMELSGRGDVLVSTSGTWMELAVKRGLVDPETVADVAYATPAILVQKGNPEGITTLESLADSGVSLALARPGAVVVGSFGAELLEEAGLAGNVRVETCGPSASQLANLVALGSADACINWAHLALLDSSRLEALPLPLRTLPRLATLSVGVGHSSTLPRAAEEFALLVAGEEGKRAYKNAGFTLAPPPGFQGEIDGAPRFDRELWR